MHKADPGKRRMTVVIVMLCALAGAGLIAVYPGFVDWAMHDMATSQTRLPWVIASLFVFAVPLLVAARALWHTGQHAAAAARFPPPDSKVIRDTPVLRGTPAIRRGRLLQWFAVATSVAVLAVPLVVWFTVRALTTTG